MDDEEEIEETECTEQGDVGAKGAPHRGCGCGSCVRIRARLIIVIDSYE